MKVNEHDTFASPVELVVEGQGAEAWSLSVQVPTSELPRFGELLERREPVVLSFHRREVTRIGPGVDPSAVDRFSGPAVLEAFPHTPAGGSARFRGTGPLKAA